MITKNNLKFDGIMKTLAIADGKELYITVDTVRGDVQYGVTNYKQGNTLVFGGDGALDAAIEVMNGLEPLDNKERREYNQYLKLKDKYKKYEGLQQQ